MDHVNLAACAVNLGFRESVEHLYLPLLLMDIESIIAELTESTVFSEWISYRQRGD